VGSGSEDAESSPECQWNRIQLAKVVDAQPAGGPAESDRYDVGPSVVPGLGMGGACDAEIQQDAGDPTSQMAGQGSLQEWSPILECAFRISGAIANGWETTSRRSQSAGEHDGTIVFAPLRRRRSRRSFR
jgi:hypothetical protein